MSIIEILWTYVDGMVWMYFYLLRNAKVVRHKDLYCIIYYWWYASAFNPNKAALNKYSQFVNIVWIDNYYHCHLINKNKLAFDSYRTFISFDNLNQIWAPHRLSFFIMCVLLSTLLIDKLQHSNCKKFAKCDDLFNFSGNVESVALCGQQQYFLTTSKFWVLFMSKLLLILEQTKKGKCIISNSNERSIRQKKRKITTTPTLTLLALVLISVAASFKKYKSNS